MRGNSRAAWAMPRSWSWVRLAHRSLIMIRTAEKSQSGSCMRFFERRIVHLQVTMRELVGPCEQGGGGLLGETAPSGIFDARHADISGHIVAGQGAQQDKKKSSSRSTNYRYANYCSHSR